MKTLFACLVVFLRFITHPFPGSLLFLALSIHLAICSDNESTSSGTSSRPLSLLCALLSNQINLFNSSFNQININNNWNYDFELIFASVPLLTTLDPLYILAKHIAMDNPNIHITFLLPNINFSSTIFNSNDFNSIEKVKLDAKKHCLREANGLNARQRQRLKQKVNNKKFLKRSRSLGINNPLTGEASEFSVDANLLSSKNDDYSSHNKKKTLRRIKNGTLDNLSFVFYNSSSFYIGNFPLVDDYSVLDIAKKDAGQLYNAFRQLFGGQNGNGIVTVSDPDKIAIIHDRFAYGSKIFAAESSLKSFIFNSGLLLGIDSPPINIKPPYFNVFGTNNKNSMVNALGNFWSYLPFYQHVARKGYSRYINNDVHVNKMRLVMSQSSHENDLEPNRVSLATSSFGNAKSKILLRTYGVFIPEDQSDVLETLSVLGVSPRAVNYHNSLRLCSTFKFCQQGKSKKSIAVIMLRNYVLSVSEIKFLSNVLSRFKITTYAQQNGPFRKDPIIETRYSGNSTLLKTKPNAKVLRIVEAEYHASQLLLLKYRQPLLVLVTDEKSMDQEEVAYHIEHRKVGSRIILNSAVAPEFLLKYDAMALNAFEFSSQLRRNVQQKGGVLSASNFVISILKTQNHHLNNNNSSSHPPVVPNESKEVNRTSIGRERLMDLIEKERELRQGKELYAKVVLLSGAIISLMALFVRSLLICIYVQLDAHFKMSIWFNEMLMKVVTSERVKSTQVQLHNHLSDIDIPKDKIVPALQENGIKVAT